MFKTLTYMLIKDLDCIKFETNKYIYRNGYQRGW